MLTRFFDETLTLRALDLYLLELPMGTALQAAHGSISYRELVVVRIETADYKGWGECSALTSATYGSASASQCFEQLRRALPQSFSTQNFADSLAALQNVIDPFAYAAVEMAMIDIALRHKNISLKQWLGATTDSIKAGAVVGLTVDNNALRSKIEMAIADGYKRIKLKITPESDLKSFGTLTTEYSELELHADANGSFKNYQSTQLKRLLDAGFKAIEQPFSPADTQSAKALTTYASKLDCFVIADEAADSFTSIQAIARGQNANAIAIKPGRLGGLTATQEVQQFCVSHGLAMAAGGMLESGLGRSVLAALAACEGFTLTGDVSPASRWLQKDPWQDLTLADGNIQVPDDVGVTLSPNNVMLAKATKQHFKYAG